MIQDCPKASAAVHKNACKLKQRATANMTDKRRALDGCPEDCRYWGRDPNLVEAGAAGAFDQPREPEPKQAPELKPPETTQAPDPEPKPAPAPKAKAAAKPKPAPAPKAKAAAKPKPKKGKDPARIRIGAEVRRLRLAKGWNQPRLAEAAGVHEGTVSNLERGANLPTPVNQEALAEALGTTWEEIERAARGGPEPETRPGPEEDTDRSGVVEVDFAGFVGLWAEAETAAWREGLSLPDWLRHLAAREVAGREPARDRPMED